MGKTVTWVDLEFEVNQHSVKWNDVPGVYMFVGVNLLGNWYPLYVGKAESLAERLPNHERWREAVQQGATHVHARIVRDPAERDVLERRLIQLYQPRLNVQHKAVGS